MECIGDDEEGKNPSIPKQKQDTDDGGQDSLPELLVSDDKSVGESSEEKKKKKDSSLAMMGAVLASKAKWEGLTF